MYILGVILFITIFFIYCCCRAASYADNADNEGEYLDNKLNN